MTALNFPDSPAAGDIYDAPNGVQYQYDGISWNVLSAAAGVPGPAGPQGEPGPVGPIGPIGFRYAGRVGTEADLAGLIDVADLYDVYVTNDTGIGYQVVPVSQNANGKGWNVMGRFVGQDGAEGPQGPAGVDGVEGPEGPQGMPGLGLRFVMRVPTVGDLPATATQGDIYIVEATGDGHVWDETIPGFINSGPIVGPTGSQGSTGPQGEAGVQGPAGADGEVGPAGPQGEQGITGADGPQGIQGEVGPQGAQGIQGETGPAGADGAAGVDGAAGPKGDTGDQGIQGEVGPKGDQGVPGEVGAEGPVGPAGAQGDTGPVGPQGEVGPKGDTGDQGIPGLGITFKGRVATVGDLPATAIQGDMYIVEADGNAWVWSDTVSAFENAGPIVGPTGSQGEAGPTGATGPEGQQGPAGPTAVSVDANNTSVIGTDGLLFTPAPDLTGYVPRTGADMTGQLNFKGDGAVSFQFDNGFNFQGLAQSSALRMGTKSLLGFTADDVVAAVPFRLTSEPTVDTHAVTKKYVDDKVAAGGGNTSGLPTTGGTMTGTITLPTTIQSLLWGASTYNIFGANGGVAVRYGNSNIVNFTGTGTTFTQKITTPGTGQGIEFGSGGGYLSKVSAGIGAYIGGQLRLTIGSTDHKSTVPILLPADPVNALEAATKQYADNKPTIVSIPAGGTPPDASLYPNNTLLVEYV